MRRVILKAVAVDALLIFIFWMVFGVGAGGWHWGPQAQAAASSAGQVPDASTPSPPSGSGFPAPAPPLFPGHRSGMSGKQQRAILKENLKQAKKDAAKLSTLADSLKKEIDSSNPNVISVDVFNKANEIEKLAKKIKAESEM